ncbi:hypothetical protein [Ralstonia phage RSP15]|uniref:terminase small subunit n=1 Tax=Ralstonia phage RSP15 TaxID=1785960 RepID=UPI00074D4139|nr:terminase small subunit [Ralstonia phage RSP15]BAU39997.1 hypothetical protein [Ralstonia phage RSP15]
MSSRLKESLGISDSQETDTTQTAASFFGVSTEESEDFNGEEVPHVEPPKFELVEVESTVPDLISTDAKTDYVKARNITHTLLGMTGDAVAGALAVAKESEHPRAYGVFNELVATMRTLTQDLLAMQKVYKEVTKDRPETINVIQNNTQINNSEGGITAIPGSLVGASDLLSLVDKARSQLKDLEVIDMEEDE